MNPVDVRNARAALISSMLAEEEARQERISRMGPWWCAAIVLYQLGRAAGWLP